MPASKDSWFAMGTSALGCRDLKCARNPWGSFLKEGPLRFPHLCTSFTPFVLLTSEVWWFGSLRSGGSTFDYFVPILTSSIKCLVTRPGNFWGLAIGTCVNTWWIYLDVDPLVVDICSSRERRSPSCLDLIFLFSVNPNSKKIWICLSIPVSCPPPWSARPWTILMVGEVKRQIGLLVWEPTLGNISKTPYVILYKLSVMNDFATFVFAVKLRYSKIDIK